MRMHLASSLAGAALRAGADLRASCSSVCGLLLMNAAMRMVGVFRVAEVPRTSTTRAISDQAPVSGLHGSALKVGSGRAGFAAKTA